MALKEQTTYQGAQSQQCLLTLGRCPAFLPLSAHPLPGGSFIPSHVYWVPSKRQALYQAMGIIAASIHASSTSPRPCRSLPFSPRSTSQHLRFLPWRLLLVFRAHAREITLPFVLAPSPPCPQPMTNGIWWLNTPAPSPLRLYPGWDKAPGAYSGSLTDCLPFPPHFLTPYHYFLGSLLI